MDLSAYRLETLHEHGEFVLYRGHAVANPPSTVPSVLVSMPTSPHPALDRVRMLEREWALRTQLESSWAVSPIALAEYQGRPVLIVEKLGANDRARRDHRGPSWIAGILVAPSNLQKSMAPKLVRPMAAPTRAWTIFLRHVR